MKLPRRSITVDDGFIMMMDHKYVPVKRDSQSNLPARKESFDFIDRSKYTAKRSDLHR